MVKCLPHKHKDCVLPQHLYRTRRGGLCLSSQCWGVETVRFPELTGQAGLLIVVQATERLISKIKMDGSCLTLTSTYKTHKCIIYSKCV